MNLFELALEYKEAYDSLMSIEGAATEDIQDTLDGVMMPFEEKVVHISSMIQNMKYMLIAIEEAKKDIEKKKERVEKSIESLKRYVINGMSLAKIHEISCPTYTVSLKKNPPKLNITDDKLVPDTYYRTETKRFIDNAQVRSDLKNNVDVPGAELTQGMSLIIR